MRTRGGRLQWHNSAESHSSPCVFHASSRHHNQVTRMVNEPIIFIHEKRPCAGRPKVRAASKCTMCSVITDTLSSPSKPALIRHLSLALLARCEKGCGERFVPIDPATRCPVGEGKDPALGHAKCFQGDKTWRLAFIQEQKRIRGRWEPSQAGLWRYVIVGGGGRGGVVGKGGWFIAREARLVATHP